MPCDNDCIYYRIVITLIFICSMLLSPHCRVDWYLVVIMMKDYTI
eukprot:SAG31_NODE_3612_length_4067_cov_13.889617_6_plen_45_part_00